ncbi:MAG: HEAT repeat domain-containing protein, partial [Deltaproteobacteria bacterium]|nr:HEAT repeat domain-containing protein [Deltaproteobacteria bacterium]
ISDETSVNVLIQELQNPHPGVVIYALKTLETVEQESLRYAIPSLLVHSSAEVRQQALECVDRLHMTSALNPLRERIQKESDPAVVGILLRTLSALAGADSADILIRYIHDPNPQIRTGAIIEPS